MKDPRYGRLVAALSGLSKLLPGDHIHHVADISAKQAPRRFKEEAIEAARLKRERKVKLRSK
jgi:hypothetical protein